MAGFCLFFGVLSYMAYGCASVLYLRALSRGVLRQAGEEIFGEPLDFGHWGHVLHDLSAAQLPDCTRWHGHGKGRTGFAVCNEITVAVCRSEEHTSELQSR